MVAATSTSPSSPQARTHHTGTPKRIPMLKGGQLVWGHLPLLANEPLALTERVRDELGDIGSIRVAHQRVIFVMEPAAIEHILVDRAKNYTKQTRGYGQLRKMLGNGLVTSEGSFWLRQRRIAQPAFHREKLGAIAQVMERDTDEMLAGWRDGAEVHEPFDFNAEMTRLTMRIIGEALFSVDVSGDSDAAGAAVNELVHQSMARTVNLLAPPLFLPTPMNRRYLKARDTLDALVYGVINARRKGDSRPDLLSMLLETVDEETGERMSDKQLRDEVLTLFAAGHETTSMAVSWTLHALLDSPNALAKLQDEIDQAPVTIERVMRMPYLDAVVKEGLRLYPPVWMVARSVEEDDVVSGYQFHKGDMLFVSQWGTHRHPRLWDRATQFVPERFLGSPALEKYAYFPFLGGPRKCIGDQLAILETKVILARVLSAMTFARAKEKPPVVADPAVTMRMLHGLWVTARPRA